MWGGQLAQKQQRQALGMNAWRDAEHPAAAERWRRSGQRTSKLQTDPENTSAQLPPARGAEEETRA
jgi:hypothetical protein